MNIAEDKSLAVLIPRHKAIHKVIMQSEHAALQKQIDSGLAWKLEGSVGRAAMAALEAGACVLSEEVHHDYWGNMVPAYWMIKDEAGCKGSLANAEQFYKEDN